MSYLVLARKYRPQTFDEVVAQEHVTRTLRNALKNNRIGSGYLFCGPRGTGKTTVARILAKSVNCVEGPTEKPCGKCPACVEITTGSSLDVVEIDAASNTSVDDVRTLRENVRYLPTSGNKRIYIVDEVHRLSGSAFDALLKTLEEPPSHVMFIFATTEPLKVPDTIHSRTQRFDFRRVSVADVTRHLQDIIKSEGMEADEAALKLVARKGDGSVRDSLSLLDQVVAYAGDKITEESVVQALGLVDRQFLFDYTQAIAESDRRKVLDLTRQLFEAGIDISDFVEEILEHLRILLLLDSDPESITLLGLSVDEVAAYKQQGENFKAGDILRMIKVMTDLNRDLKDSGLDERLLIEVAGAKLAEMESTIRFEDLLAQMQSGVQPEAPSGAQKTGGDLFGTSQKKNLETTLKSAPAREEESKSVTFVRRAPNLAQIKAGWPQFLTRLRSQNPMVASQLGMAKVKSARDNTVEIVFAGSEEVSMKVVQKPENLKLISRTLADHFGTNFQVTCSIDETMEVPSSADEGIPRLKKVDAEKLIERSPRIRSLLEKVDGEIIGVRKIEEENKS